MASLTLAIMAADSCPSLRSSRGLLSGELAYHCDDRVPFSVSFLPNVGSDCFSDFLAWVTIMRQTIEARYHDGVLLPLDPLALVDEADVQVTVDTEVAMCADEILRRATQAYQGLTADQIAEVETIALDRQQFFL
jgi:predicted DNA-binding antitoxin AbrB/MazE fold protein